MTAWNTPWRVSLPDETMVIDADGNPVASVAGDYETEYAEMAKLASLLASAPLLYKALADMIDSYNNLTDFGEECHAVVAARAALARATGETK